MKIARETLECMLELSLLFWSCHFSSGACRDLARSGRSQGTCSLVSNYVVTNMGNNKNKRNHRNSHRHAFRKMKSPYEHKKLTPITPKGSRIINSDKLQLYVKALRTHSARCEGHVVLTGETKHGLASILQG